MIKTIALFVLAAGLFVPALCSLRPVTTKYSQDTIVRELEACQEQDFGPQPHPAADETLYWQCKRVIERIQR